MKPRPPKDYPFFPGFDPSPEPERLAKQPEQPQPKPAKMVLIHRQENGVTIDQRVTDGYINATAMCRAYDARFNDYSAVKKNQRFLDRLAFKTGIPVLQLVQSQHGGPRQRGTWVHPLVAWHLAHWVSPEFAVAVSFWLEEWFKGNLQPSINQDSFEVRRLLGLLLDGQQAEGRQLYQLQQMITESWMALLHMAYAGSTRTDHVTPPPWTGKRQLTGSTGRPPLVEPRRPFNPNHKGFAHGR